MNVLNTPSHVNRDSYNVIPLEQRTEFSSTVGELLPVYYDILNPGEKVTINNLLRTRTMELNSAAFCHLTEHIDWFAVPLSQLYKPIESMQFGIKDLHSDFYGDPTLNVGRIDYPTIDANAFTLYFKTIATSPDKYFPSIKGTGMRLMELLDIPLHKYGFTGTGEPSLDSVIQMPMNFTFWLLASYQKIYMDYFRISDREVNNPQVYNFDSYWNGGNVTSSGALSALFTLRYRPWNKDFFTYLYTSPLMGVDSIGSWNVSNDTQSPLVNMFSQWLTGLNGGHVSLDTPSYAGPSIGDSDDITSNTVYPSTVSLIDEIGANLGNVNPDNIRTSFAVEKLLEITRRAGKHVDQQLLAHFGVKVSPKVAGEVEHIYHSSSEIMIGDVIATSASDSNAFGQVGGKGYGSGNGKFKWTNDYPCPVVLMAIYSCNPDVDYAVTGLGRLNTYNKNSDFFHPEFDNLGMQPQFGYQRNLIVAPSIFDRNYQIPGWQYKWMELKSKSNRTCGALARSLYFWTTRRNILNLNVDLSSFLVNPMFLNPIMQKDYDFGATFDWDLDVVEPTEFTDGPSSSLFDSDPLIHEFYVHCNKATKMSAFSLPSL